jgi:hypothetical protein
MERWLTERFEPTIQQSVSSSLWNSNLLLQSTHPLDFMRHCKPQFQVASMGSLAPLQRTIQDYERSISAPTAIYHNQSAIHDIQRSFHPYLHESSEQIAEYDCHRHRDIPFRKVGGFPNKTDMLKCQYYSVNNTEFYSSNQGSSPR